MRHGLVSLASGFAVLLSGFLFKTISYTNLLGRAAPYMGPPMDPISLRVERMWSFPYILDTISLVLLGAGIVLILLGVVLSIRGRTRLPPKEITLGRDDTLYPYH
jgi:hypothetical protein